MTITLPSLGHLVDAGRRAARRFPLVLLAGVVTAAAGIVFVNAGGDDKQALRLMLAAALGLPLNFALAVAAERRARSRAAHWLIASAGVVILTAFWYAFPRWTEPQQAMRFVQLAAAVHLFVAFAPFIGTGEPGAFWQYNRILLQRFILAALYAAVLWMGVSGALLALDKLFGLTIEGEAYARLWMVMTFVFHPWFFLSGMPEDIGALETVTDYPRELRFFTQYVLVPIGVTYLVILTLYLGKVVVTREWPSGWIGYLVSGVAAVGILSWLLVHPLEERAEHAWVKTFTRGFWIALLPAIVMLWLAIWKRVDQYGITERRYFLAVLSLWLAGIALYYTFSRSRSIKVIPATLCAIAILSFAGPWGAYAVSRWSQTNRLEGVLARNGILGGGTVRPAPRAVPDSDATAIRSGFRYLLATHGRPAVDRLLPDTLRARVGAARASQTPDATTREILNVLRVPWIAAGQRGREPGTFTFGVRRQNAVVNIAGYSHVVEFSLSSVADSVVVRPRIALRLSADSTALLVTRDGAPALVIPLVPVVDTISRHADRPWQVPERYMQIEHRAGGAEVGALLRLVSISGVGTPRRVTALAGDLYLKLAGGR